MGREKYLRSQLKYVKRLTIEFKHSVLFKTDRLSLGNIGNNVEQIVRLQQEGKQILLISPSFIHSASQTNFNQLFEEMFRQFGVGCYSITTNNDEISNPRRRGELINKMEEMMQRGKICVLLNQSADRSSKAVSDRSITFRIAKEMNSELLVILSEIDKVYRRDPSKHPGEASITSLIIDPTHNLSTMNMNERVGKEFNMQGIVKAINDDGMGYIAIINGLQHESLIALMGGELVGILFTSKAMIQTPNQSNMSFSLKDLAYYTIHHDKDVREIAVQAKESAMHLREYTAEERAILLGNLALIIHENIELILESNEEDLQSFVRDQRPDDVTNPPMTFTEERLNEIVKELHSLSLRLKKGDDPLNDNLYQCMLEEGLELIQSRAPLGVLLVIAEGRPDLLPQLVGLSVASGNSVIVQHDASLSARSHRVLFQLLQQGLENGLHSVLFYNSLHSPQAMNNQIKLNNVKNHIGAINKDISSPSSSSLSSSLPSSPSSSSPSIINQENGEMMDDKGRSFNDYYRKLMKGVLGMVGSKDELNCLLKIGEDEKLIDAVIPRNFSLPFAKSIHPLPNPKSLLSTLSPTSSYLYIHPNCEMEKAIRIVIDSLAFDDHSLQSSLHLLIDRKLFDDSRVERLINALVDHSVLLLATPRTPLFTPPSPPSSSNKLSIDMVDDLKEAITVIRNEGSEYVNGIITEDYHAAHLFQLKIDSLFVLWNCSTRIADSANAAGISPPSSLSPLSSDIDRLTCHKFKLNSLAKGGHCWSDCNVLKDKSPARL